MGFFNLKSPQMSYLALSTSFEYLCFWIYGHYKYLNYPSAGIDYRRLKSVPALKR